MVSTPEGFERWYGELHPRLLGAVLVVVGDADLAADAVDEAFVRAWERWDRVAAMASPAGWTYRVAVNVAKRQARRRALADRLIRRATPAASTEPPPGLAVEVWDATRRLPERQREALVLRYLLDLTQPEAAAAMGVRPGTVAATLTAARRALRPLLTDEPDGGRPEDVEEARGHG